jgi:hypothetical protein
MRILILAFILLTFPIWFIGLMVWLIIYGAFSIVKFTYNWVLEDL